eukprot:TRINITY_DN11004_c3_g1_i1.p1 TRINITY_DN11004_c3_g1~~TRINITY_DN11004_c3_g1_i1.p1  ORF type:complete len:410 (+),score=81.93 TRINITY_DN11004_c3_g1_i1:47-1231(+)
MLQQRRNDYEDLEKCIQEIENQKQETTKELEGLVRLHNEDKNMVWTRPRIEGLERRCVTLEKQKTAYANRLATKQDQQLQKTQQQHLQKTLKEEDISCNTEGHLVEQYGAEIRTTFVKRGDRLRLRITNTKTTSVYDSFDKGRSDSLHTYNFNTESGYSKTCFFPGRSDAVTTYTKWTEDSVSYYATQQTGITRTISLHRDEVINPLSDTPSAFKKKINEVCITVDTSNTDSVKTYYYKSTLSQSARVWESLPPGDQQCNGEEQEVTLFSYGLSDSGTLLSEEGRDDVSLPAAEMYEKVLQHECETVSLVLNLEREHMVFSALHEAGTLPQPHSLLPFTDSQPARVAVLTDCISKLFSTIDTADTSAIRSQRQFQQNVSVLEKQLAVATFDPKA